MKEVCILDTTLRDGEQTAGVAFSINEKILIAKMLDEAGVDILETGIPVMGGEELEYLQQLSSLGLKATLLSWNRMKTGDIDSSILAGIKNVHISAPVSDIHIYKKLNKDRDWVLREIVRVIEYTCNKGCTVSVGAEDASRAELDYLIQFFKTVQQSGAVRVRYADTLGIMEPLSTYQIIRKIKDEIEIDIDFHGHNDFGMATANALSAYKAGAKYISCTVNGLGERAGNTALEEIVMALKYLLKTEIEFKIKKLTGLSELVVRASGRQIAHGKPIVGQGVYSHEAGIHVDGLLKDTATYEFFSPEELGRQRKFILGKHSGRNAVMNSYLEQGIKIDQHMAEGILTDLRSSKTYA